MEALIVKTKNKSELTFLSALFKRMNIESKVLSKEEKDDLDLGHEMKLPKRSGKGDAEKMMAHINAHL